MTNYLSEKKTETSTIELVKKFIKSNKQTIKNLVRRHITAKKVSISEYAETSVKEAIALCETEFNVVPSFIVTQNFLKQFQKPKTDQLNRLLDSPTETPVVFCGTRINQEVYPSLIEFCKNGGNVLHMPFAKLYAKLLYENRLKEGGFVPSHSLEFLSDSSSVQVAKTPVDLSEASYNFKVLCPQLNLLFYEVPKNASSSIKTMLFSMENESRYNTEYMQFMNPKEWQKRFPAMNATWDDVLYSPFLKFAFLRNPYERILSGYFNTGWHNINKDISFAEFIERLPEKMKAPPSDMVNIHYKPFTYFIPKKSNGQFHIDFIGKVENFEEDMKAIFHACNVKVDFKLPKINKSKNVHYQDFYTPQIRKAVENLYGEDIELGKYSF